MEKIFWVIPGKLAGRAGPEMEPWDIGQIRSCGITTIVSTDEACHAESIAAEGIKHLQKFMPTAYPTNPALVKRFVDLVRDAASATLDAVASGEVVLVHCYAGRDRTGLVLCATLMELENIDALTALARLKQVRPMALSGPGVLDVLREYELLLRSGGF